MTDSCVEIVASNSPGKLLEEELSFRFLLRGWYFHFRVGKSQNRRTLVAKLPLISVDWSLIRLGVIFSSQHNLVYLKSTLSTWKTGFCYTHQPADCRVGVRRPAPPPWTHRKRKLPDRKWSCSPNPRVKPFRSQSRENRSKVTVRAVIHSESTGFASRPEPEVARPETQIAPVAGPSFGDITAVSSRSQSVESGSEAGVEPQSGYPLPAPQKPEITLISFHPIANPPSSTYV